MKKLSFSCLLFLFHSLGVMAHGHPSLKIAVSIAPQWQASFKSGGRLIFHVSSSNEKEPRFKSELIIGTTPSHWDAARTFRFSSKEKTVQSYGWGKLHANSKVYVQIVYKQSLVDGTENAEGNLFSYVDSLEWKDRGRLHLVLAQMVPAPKVMHHPLIKTIEVVSKLLSDFSGHPRLLKASILLPSSYYKNTGEDYPICYRVPGLNGRFDQINTVMNKQEFSDWWCSGKAPQVIYVFLDSQGPYGDTYQMDSENNGPCGRALTEELIPAVEEMVHYKSVSHQRYLAGRSTGGWVVLGLQIFYPDFFDGAWSYSPDPVDFEHYGLIDIYHDSTVFYNKYGYLQPGKRTINGEPTFSMKEWIYGENLVSSTDDYRISGGQFGAYNAVFGPKGADGLPTLMFDPVTGRIDVDIARKWDRYDLKKVLEKNWTVIGPKLQGKIWIWMGDMDGLYSNVATRFLQKMLEKTNDPKSDAIIRFTPMAGHTQEWSDKAVIEMVSKKSKNKL